MRLGINNKSETSEISIKGKTGNIIEQMGNNDIGDSVTKRKPFVFREFFEGFFSSHSHGIIIMNHVQRGLNRINKFNGKIITCPVPEKRYSLADYIPCCIKTDFIFFAEFEEFAGTAVIGVFKTKRGKEE